MLRTIPWKCFHFATNLWVLRICKFVYAVKLWNIISVYSNCWLMVGVYICGNFSANTKNNGAEFSSETNWCAVKNWNSLSGAINKNKTFFSWSAVNYTAVWTLILTIDSTIYGHIHSSSTKIVLFWQIFFILIFIC